MQVIVEKKKIPSFVVISWLKVKMLENTRMQPNFVTDINFQVIDDCTSSSQLLAAIFGFDRIEKIKV